MPYVSWRSLRARIPQNATLSPSHSGRFRAGVAFSTSSDNTVDLKQSPGTPAHNTRASRFEGCCNFFS
ncbi:hypothetical protein CYMTET_26568 [Cymbomonas tetramitiformis]|uniref:Uncharacterized protein n=1 Tax=Cymbomonas tetramitiformis TaxID=36881 RepID=A0AAE0FS84_9CHLO|nr:hypothetical protein CYMTET_26568 [Cymbomonas tetramitiformis]